MATRTLASSPSSNSDLTRQGSIYSLTIAELQNTVGDSNKNFGSMSMDELVRNIWTTEENQAMAAPFATLSGAGNLSRQGSVSMPTHVGNKTVEEVWKEISGVCSGAGDERKIYKEPTFGEMTLEDFLTRAGVVRDEEVRVSAEAAVAAAVPGEWGGFPAAEAVILQEQIQQQQQQQIELFGNGNLGLGFGNELVVNVEGQGGQGGQSGQSGRERRRGAQEPVDKVAQQRQRRMIKNRESAARSRERKQAYTVELESLVTQLEEENAELVRQQMEHTKKRLKQLIENLIPVDEVKRPRPPRVLRKTRSIHCKHSVVACVARPPFLASICLLSFRRAIW